MSKVCVYVCVSAFTSNVFIHSMRGKAEYKGANMQIGDQMWKEELVKAFFGYIYKNNMYFVYLFIYLHTHTHSHTLTYTYTMIPTKQVIEKDEALSFDNC